MPPSASRAIVQPTTLHEAERRAPRALRLAQRGQRVGRLARLRDHEHERVAVDDRVAVAELRRVLDLDRDARELLDQVLADQRRVPARAAGGDDDAVELPQLLRRQVQAAELAPCPSSGTRRPRIAFSSVSGCSKISLSMKWSKPPFSIWSRSQSIWLTPSSPICASRSHDLVAVARQHRHLAVVEVDDLARVLRGSPPRRSRRSTRPVAEPDQQRAALARRDDLVRIVRSRSPRCRTCPRRARARRSPPPRDSPSNASSIRCASTSVSVSDTNLCPVFCEHRAQRAVVLDDAVVHHRDRALAVVMRVRVASRSARRASPSACARCRRCRRAGSR